MFLGPPMRLNLNPLDGGDPPQYPELHLGYSARNLGVEGLDTLLF
jgi:hypothetical protein